MKKLLLKTALLLMPVSAIVFLLMFLPYRANTTEYMLFSFIDKEKLLKETPAPRVVFIGGSNLGLGLNSQLIKDSLKLNPVNTAVHAGLGIHFMLSYAIEHIKKGDIVIIAAEYEQFYTGLANGDYVLLKLMVDVSPQNRKLLDINQYLILVENIPEFAREKLNHFISPYRSKKVGVYDRKSYNQYGDGYIHWNLPKGDPLYLFPLKGKQDKEVYDDLVHFKNLVTLKGGRVFITFPALSKPIFEQSKTEIFKIEKNLKDLNFSLLGNAERYKMDKNLIFDSPYHLTKEGTDYRTRLIIEDLKLALKNGKE